MLLVSALLFLSLLSPPPSRRPLPSFPTRRSSDLEGDRLAAGEHSPRACGAQRRAGPRREDAVGRVTAHDDDHRSRARRSEEHTSELQSPCNLVCRLLLEKKNTNTEQKRTTVLVTR